MSKLYNLNVSDRYVIDWGAWEVLREIVTNAMDADPSWEITKVNDDHVKVYTSTVPRLGDMIVIGQGTKDADDNNIGQFGEGFKLAALCAVRAGGSFAAVTSDGSLDFTLQQVEEFDANILHSTHHPDSRPPNGGCYVDIQMRGIGTLSKSRFLPDPSLTQLKKAEPRVVNVYLKGVWVKALEQFGLFDWNLHQAKINRDRTMVEMWDCKMEIARFLLDPNNLTLETAKQLISHPRSFEVDALSNEYYPEQEAKDIFTAAFHDLHGDRAVLPSKDTRVNEYAVLAGYAVINISATGLKHMLDGGVQTADDVMPEKLALDKIAKQRVHSDHPLLKDARRLLNRLNVPCELLVFKETPETIQLDGHVDKGPTNREDEYLGHGRVRIWIKESLLTDTSAFFRTLFTYVSAAKTQFAMHLSFEGSMIGLAGAIAEAWVNDTGGNNLQNPPGRARRKE
jgi:hypothetical protein